MPELKLDLNFDFSLNAIIQAVLLLIICLSYSVALWGVVMAWPEIFAGIFTAEQALREFAGKALRIYFSGMVIFGIQIACQMTFVSIGNAFCSIVVRWCENLCCYCR